MHLLAVDPQPVQHYTVWEHLGYGLLLSGIGCLYLCYRLGFKVKAHCLVVGSASKKPCPKKGTVVLGCQHHKWKKPIAWLRHLGAAAWLDPWLYRLHVVPPSFAPMPMPTVQAGSAGAAPSENLARPGSRMTLEVRIAMWALVFAIIQASTGVIALVIAD